MSTDWSISSIGAMPPPPSGITSAQLLEHNVQAYVELSYIRAGNEVMAVALSDLETALTQTQASLNSLATVQKLHNQLAPPDASKMPFDFTDSNQVVTYSQNITSIQLPNPSEPSATLSAPISLTDNQFTVASPFVSDEVFTYRVTQTILTVNNPADAGETTTFRWNLNNPGGVTTIENPGNTDETIRITANVSGNVVYFSAVNPVSSGIVLTYVEAPTLVMLGRNYLTDNQVTDTYTFTIPYAFGTGTARTEYVAMSVDGDINKYVSAYNKVASSFYGTPIDPLFKVTIPANYFGAGNPPKAVASVITSYSQPAFTYYFNTLVSAKQQISGIISYLSTLSNASMDQHGLLDQLHAVYDTLPPLTDAQTNFSAVRSWLLDGYNIHGASGVANQGKIQNGITAAITASESLNDSQKESVRNYMFIFEEYYKSAAATLTAISQMIQKMAQNVAR